jgi:hypothetical protein
MRQGQKLSKQTMGPPLDLNRVPELELASEHLAAQDLRL